MSNYYNPYGREIIAGGVDFGASARGIKLLLRQIMTPIMERRFVLPLPSLARGCAGLSALPQEAAQVNETGAQAQTEQFPVGFTRKSAMANGVKINYKITGSSGSHIWPVWA